jgi:hypothetical protein
LAVAEVQYRYFDKKNYVAGMECSIEEPIPEPKAVLRKFQPGEDWASTPLFAATRSDDEKIL